MMPTIRSAIMTAPNAACTFRIAGTCIVLSSKPVTKGGASTDARPSNQGPVRRNGAFLLFKQAVGSTHRAVVDIRVHFERLHAVHHWIDGGLPADTFYARTRNEAVAMSV